MITTLDTTKPITAHLGWKNSPAMRLQLLSPKEALQAARDGKELFFSDGYAERYSCYYPGTLLSVEYGTEIPYRADCPDYDEAWYCNCWEVLP